MLVADYVDMGKGKYRVTFENGIVLVLYRGEISRLSISAGTEITEEEYDFLLSVVAKRAKKRALYLLEKMDRSEAKLREKLSSNEYPKQCIDDAIEYVKSFHYLDDLRLAKNYVRYHQESLSRQQISVKLIQKGIRRDEIAIALDEEYFADEEEQIRKILQKKQFSYEEYNEKNFRRMYQYLLRRGFKCSDIIIAMKSPKI